MDSTLVIHAPDTQPEALIFCAELEMVGFPARHLGSLLQRTTLSIAIQARKSWLLNAPAIIIMGSEELFRDRFYLDISLLAMQSRRQILVLYEQGGLTLPAWFIEPVRLKSIEAEPAREWNRLVQQLMRVTGEFSDFEPYE